jgi:predicted  nucleic acid-binding Zn-ribbon protein
MADDAVVLANQLLNLKRQIEVDKEKKAHLEGQLASLMSRLEKEFACATIEDAEVKVAKLSKDIEKLTGLVREKITAIQQQYSV